MAIYSGRKGAVGIAKETVRGTAVAAAFWLPLLDRDFEDQFETVENDSALGVLTRVNESNIVQRRGEGSLEGKVYDKSFGLLLALALGAAPTSAAMPGGDSAVYEHTYALSNTNQGLTGTITMKDPNLDVRFPRSTIDSFTITVAVDEYVKWSADWISDKSSSTTSTAAYADENEFLPKHVSVSLASNLAGLDAASPISITSFEMEINKNLEATQVIGNEGIADVVTTAVEISGTMEMYYDDVVFRDYMINQTIKALRLKIQDTSVTIGAAQNPTIQIDLAKVKFTSFEKDQGNDDLVKVTVEFTGQYDTTAAKSITALVRNLQTSY